MNQATELIQETGAAREELLQTVENLSNKQASFKPDPQTWSVNENLEHLVLAEVSGISKIWAAAEGFRTGEPVWSGEHTNKNLPIDEIIVRTWKPKEIAPPIATPHIGGPIAYWRDYLRISQTLLERVAPALEGLPLEVIIFPHFLSGPLDLGQRLEFLAFHIRRHHRQIRDVMNGPSFPAV